MALFHTFLHLLFAFPLSEHLNDLLLSKCLHVAWETKNICRLIGLLRLLHLKFIAQLILWLEPRNRGNFGLFAFHKSLHQLLLLVVLLSFLIIGLVSLFWFNVGLWDELLFMSFPFLEVWLDTFVCNFVLVLLWLFLFGMFRGLFVLFPIQSHRALCCSTVVHDHSFFAHFSSIIKNYKLYQIWNKHYWQLFVQNLNSKK